MGNTEGMLNRRCGQSIVSNINIWPGSSTALSYILCRYTINKMRLGVNTYQDIFYPHWSIIRTLLMPMKILFLVCTVCSVL